MTRIKRLFASGSAGNEQLTTMVAAVLLLLLAIETATLLQLRSLLTVHAFVGLLLIPVVALKLASSGWRMVRYYRRGEEYVRRGVASCSQSRLCRRPTGFRIARQRMSATTSTRSLRRWRHC